MLEIAEKLQQLVGRQNRNLRLLADGALRQVGLCVCSICVVLSSMVVQFMTFHCHGMSSFCSISVAGIGLVAMVTICGSWQAEHSEHAMK